MLDRIHLERGEPVDVAAAVAAAMNAVRGAPRWWRIAAASCLLVAGLAALLAHESQGMTYPSLFLDPYARFSAVDLPGLDTSRLGLRNPDPLIAIDGVPVDCPVTAPGGPRRCVQDQFESRRRAGDRTVVLRFDHHGGHVDVERRLAAVGPAELITLFLIYAAGGLLALWSGLVVIEHTAPSAGSLAYAAWSLSSALFYFTFFDYHTTALLTPVFSVATVAVELSSLWLALTFPTFVGASLLRRPALAVTIAGVALAAWLVVAPVAFHRDPVAAREFVGAAAPACYSALALTLLFRWWRADRTTRAVLRAAALGLAVVPALMALGFALAATTGVDLIHAFLPALAVMMPLSTGYSLVRHNALGARAVAGCAMFELPGAALAIAVAGLLWIELPGNTGALASLLGGAGLWLGLTRRLGHRLFPARPCSRHSVEALRDALSERKSIGDVTEALEAIIQRWLSVRSADVIPSEQFTARGLPTDVLALARQGEVHVDERGSVLVPVRAVGELRAVVIVGARCDGGPFNAEDVALLETIAGFGGLALHNAHVLEELDRLRRTHIDAAGREKQATIALLGAEVAHEVAYSLSYLRFLLRDEGHLISAEDIEVGRDEIARLERMLGGLRRLAPPPPRIAPTPLFAPIRQAAILVREQVTCNAITIDLEETAVVAQVDRDELVQVMANLLRNAIQAVGRGGEIRVRCAASEQSVLVRVVDDGPGVPAELEARLFTPWASGRPGGTGLGLAVAARIVRGWGGSMRYDRCDGRSEFVIEIPQVLR